MTDYIICLDVGGSSIKSGIIFTDNPKAGPICRTELKEHASAEEIAKILADIITLEDKKIHDVPAGHLRRVGIAFPGPCDYERGIPYITGLAKFEALYNVAIKDMIYSYLDPSKAWEIRMRNDAEAAVLGEVLHGAGQDVAAVLGITLGTGCGSRYIVDKLPTIVPTPYNSEGWLYSWPVTHILSPEDRHLVATDALADDVFSIRGLMYIAQVLGAAGDTPLELAEAALAGNEEAQMVYSSFGRLMGIFLKDVCSFLQPELIIIMGRISWAQDLFLSQVQDTVSVPIRCGMLNESAAHIGLVDLFHATL